MSLHEIIAKIRELEAEKDQSLTLNLNGDGSSSLSDFWNDEIIESFDDLDQLAEFFNKK